MSFKSYQALNNRYLEICDKLESDDSLTEEENKYYEQLAKRLYNEIIEEIKETKEKLLENPIKLFEENKLNTINLFEFDPDTKKLFSKVKKWKKSKYRKYYRRL